MKSLIKLTLVIAVFSLVFAPGVLAADKWQGTDDLVDSKMQEVSGVSAKEPLIDISQGNLGLFLFAAGGFGAGLITGYQWRKIFGEKAGLADD